MKLRRRARKRRPIWPASNKTFCRTVGRAARQVNKFLVHWFATILATVLLFFGCTSDTMAAEQTKEIVEVYWKHDRSLALGDIKSLIIFDESICRAEMIGDRLHLIGLARGETQVFYWTGEQPQVLLVKVVEKPEKPSPPSLRAPGEGAGVGNFGSSLQSATGAGRDNQFSLFHHAYLQEQIGENRLSVQARWQNAVLPASPLFNFTAASIEYTTPTARFALLDSDVNLAGGNQAQIVPLAMSAALVLRGFDVRSDFGDNRVELFGGVTPSPMFVNLSGSRGALGFIWTRHLSQRLSVFSTTAATAAPALQLQGVSGSKYRQSGLELAGATLAISPNWKIQGMAGLSTAGGLVQGAVSYTGAARSAFAAVTRSSVDFPLNQLRLLPSGRVAATAGFNWPINLRTVAAFQYQHSSTETVASAGGSSNYLNSNIAFTITPHLRLNGNYLLTSTSGYLSLNPRSVGNRGGLELSAEINRRIGYTARSTFGGVRDPFQYQAQSSFSLDNTFNLRLPAQNTLLFNVSYTRTNPSLLARLVENVYLLSPVLQTLFWQDPVSFLREANLPPDVSNLLMSLQPSISRPLPAGSFSSVAASTLAPALVTFAPLRIMPATPTRSRSA